MSKVVPEGWKKSSIGQITSTDSLFSDGDWVESKDQDMAGSNRLIQLADIGDGEFLNKSSRYMNDEQFDRLKCTALKKDDILIARMPEPLGRACLYPFKDGKAATVVDVAILRTNNADHYWLMSAINSSDYRYQIELNASGTTRTRIARGVLANIEILEPPLQEQQKIATILSSVDNVIEKTRTQIDKLKDLKTGMMQELLTKGIGHTEFKDSPVGRIPKVWEVGTIADLGEIITGNTPKTSDSSNYGGKIPFVSPADLGDAAYIEITKSCITEKGLLETRELPRGSVCVVCIGSTIGKTGITKKRSATNQQINSIICERAYSEYVYYLLTHYSEKIKSEAGTQAVPIINKSSFSRLQVQIPLYDEQIKIGNTLSGVDFKISVITRKLTSLEKIKKALMQDLLTGKVRINDDTLTYSHSLRQEPVSITEILDENKAQYNN